jgi:hypothetical protein
MFQQFGHHPDPEGTLPTIWRANVHPDDEKRVDELLDKLLLGGIGVLGSIRNSVYEAQPMQV